MAYKIKTLLLLSVIGFAWYFWPTGSIRKPANTNNTSLESSSETWQNSNKAQPPKLSTEVEAGIDVTMINAVPIDSWLAEIENPKYSSDPVIEVASLSMAFRICDWHLFNSHHNQQGTKTHQRMLDLQAQVNKQCEAYQQQYPLWFGAKMREEKILLLTSSSVEGAQFKDQLVSLFTGDTDFDYQNFIDRRIDLSLQMKNAPLTSFGALDNGAGLFDTPLTDLFQELLQTEDGLWIMTANQLALQTLSCQWPGHSTCQPTAYFMLHKCRDDLSACGLNFPQWYESHSTPGMKKDVEVLLTYYTENY